MSVSFENGLYPKLGALTGSRSAHDEEAMFWALEQKSKRRAMSLWRPANWLPRLLSWSYEKLANYGLSVTRPLMWFAALLVVETSLIYPMVRGPRQGGETVTDYFSNVLTAALQQTFRPFWIWSGQGLADTKAVLGLDASPAALDTTLRVIATLDSLFSAILILLFILAVRRRFRME